MLPASWACIFGENCSADWWKLLWGQAQGLLASLSWSGLLHPTMRLQWLSLDQKHSGQEEELHTGLGLEA